MRVDDDEIRSNASPRQADISRLEWLGIITISVMLGGLLHDGVSTLIANARIKYELEQLRIADEKATKQLQHELARASATMQQAAIDAERARRLNSDQCQFWLQQNRLNPGNERASEGIRAHCPR